MRLGSYPKAIGLGREFSAGLLAADLGGKKLAQDLEHLRIAVAFHERRPRLGDRPRGGRVAQRAPRQPLPAGPTGQTGLYSPGGGVRHGTGLLDLRGQDEVQ